MLYGDSRETGRSNVLQRSRRRSGCDRVTIGSAVCTCSFELIRKSLNEKFEMLQVAEREQ